MLMWQIELIPDGKNVKVTWENRSQYVDLLASYRLKEFDVQIKAIRQGNDVIPSFWHLPVRKDTYLSDLTRVKVLRRLYRRNYFHFLRGKN